MPTHPAPRRRAPARLGRLALLTAAALGAALFMAGPATATTADDRARAEAQTTAAHPYDHADPQATGCSSGATTLRQVTRDGMTFQLRWSSNCQTNWVRILNYPGTVPASQRSTLWMDVVDTNRGVLVPFTGSTGLSGTRWGNMVYSPGNNCAIGRMNYKQPPSGYDIQLGSSGC